MTSTILNPRGQLSTVLVATAAALLTWVIAEPLLGIEVAVADASTGGVRQIGPVAVTVAGLLAGLAGWGLLAVLQRLTARARGVWTAVAAVVFAGSLVGPTGATTTAAMLTLVALHGVVAVVLIWGLRRSVPSTPVARDALPEEAVR